LEKTTWGGLDVDVVGRGVVDVAEGVGAAGVVDAEVVGGAGAEVVDRVGTGAVLDVVFVVGVDVGGR
jgi:hypothetical protein